MATVVLIPARMGSTRLPGKPLADIGGSPMIIHVARQARASDIGRVVVATDAEEVANIVRSNGFDAVMTRSDHASGSDRIFEALQLLDPNREIDTILNIQGDLPGIIPSTIRAVLLPLENPNVEISTLASEIKLEEEKTNPNVVKIVGSPISNRRLKALYFTRAMAPWGAGPFYHHIGLYAYRRRALEKFVKLSPSYLEQRERLEQLRAIEAGISIEAEIVSECPIGVDTIEDLQRARAHWHPRL